MVIEAHWRHIHWPILKYRITSTGLNYRFAPQIILKHLNLRFIIYINQ
jgi:hypothetical protein